MIVRAPFFNHTQDAWFSPSTNGMAVADEVAGTLDIGGNLRYDMVCLEASKITFNEPERMKQVVTPGMNVGYIHSTETGFDKDTLMLWMASHAGFRARQSQDGEGGHVADKVVGVSIKFELNCGIEKLAEAICEAEINSGDIVVIADKAISFALGRVFPRNLLEGIDPKFLLPAERKEFAERLGSHLGYPLSERQLLCIDYVGENDASVSVADHNALCAEISSMVSQRLGKAVDIVISDSDTGVDYGIPLIGAATVGASPLGVTNGLTLYEAMRVCVASEITRGHDKGIPIVICKTNPRNTTRKDVGAARDYPDTFDLSREVWIHHGLKNNYYWRVNNRGS